MSSESSTKLRIAPELIRRPMASAARVPLIEREVKERLSAAALELLFDSVGTVGSAPLSEGRCFQGRYFGSTMFKVELAALATRLRMDAVITPQRLCELLQGDPRVEKRLHKLAERDAARNANCALTNVNIELRFRHDEHSVFLDADVEATLRNAGTSQ